jgi:hypothetical protein
MRNQHAFLSCCRQQKLFSMKLVHKSFNIENLGSAVESMEGGIVHGYVVRPGNSLVIDHSLLLPCMRP